MQSRRKFAYITAKNNNAQIKYPTCTGTGTGYRVYRYTGYRVYRVPGTGYTGYRVPGIPGVPGTPGIPVLGQKYPGCTAFGSKLPRVYRFWVKNTPGVPVLGQTYPGYAGFGSKLPRVCRFWVKNTPGVPVLGQNDPGCNNNLGGATGNAGTPAGTPPVLKIVLGRRVNPTFCITNDSEE